MHTQQPNSRQQQKMNEERNCKIPLLCFFKRMLGQHTHPHIWNSTFVFFLACNWYLIAHNKEIFGPKLFWISEILLGQKIIENLQRSVETWRWPATKFLSQFFMNVTNWIFFSFIFLGKNQVKTQSETIISLMHLYGLKSHTKCGLKIRSVLFELRHSHKYIISRRYKHVSHLSMHFTLGNNVPFYRNSAPK